MIALAFIPLLMVATLLGVALVFAEEFTDVLRD